MPCFGIGATTLSTIATSGAIGRCARPMLAQSIGAAAMGKSSACNVIRRCRKIEGDGTRNAGIDATDAMDAHGAPPVRGAALPRSASADRKSARILRSWTASSPARNGARDEAADGITDIPRVADIGVQQSAFTIMPGHTDMDGAFVHRHRGRGLENGCDGRLSACDAGPSSKI